MARIFNSYQTFECNYEGFFGYCFTVLAPNARSVALVGDFIDWDQGKMMEKVGLTGIRQIIVNRPN
ncbi:MAG: glycogen-branching protein [Haloplasmataceae bacterium]|nr:glycogen-branching protein [Haloplasmataceae bacterium]